MRHCNTKPKPGLIFAFFFVGGGGKGDNPSSLRPLVERLRVPAGGEQIRET